MQTLIYDTVSHPVLGELFLICNDTGLCALDYSDYEPRMQRLLRVRYGDYELVSGADPFGYSSRLRAYLAGEMDALDQITVSLGGTRFQQQVWSLLRTIPSGTTASYGELAIRLGKPGASRAVGAANGQNPIAIVVPCHRVIGANGQLTGYAGGLARKRWLLAHEGARHESVVTQLELAWG